MEQSPLESLKIRTAIKVRPPVDGADAVRKFEKKEPQLVSRISLLGFKFAVIECNVWSFGGMFAFASLE